jgi:Ras homolog enriched in brain
MATTELLAPHTDAPVAQDEYSILNSKHAIGIHGFVLVYSVTNRSSLNMIQIIYDKIIDFCGQKEIPCVIVGSKTDLTR